MPRILARPIFSIVHPDQLGLVIFVIGLGVILAWLPVKAALALVGVAILLVLNLIYPKLALYLLIPAIPFNTLLQINLGGLALGPMEGLLGLMLVTWLLQMTIQQKIIVPSAPLLWPFLIFLGAVSLSWLSAISLKSSFVETLKWVEMLALYLFIRTNFKARESRWLILLLLLAGLAQAGLGIYQFLFKAGPAGFLLFGGRFLRAFGTFRQPNPYGGYLGLILPLTLSLSLWGLNSLRIRLKNWPDMVLAVTAWVGCGAMLAALFASQSRGAWLAFGVAAMVTVFLMGGRWTTALSIASIAAAILISMGALSLLPAAISERFIDAVPFLNIPDIARVELTDANFAILERLAHWRAAEHIWRDNLWLGVGFGNYEVVYPAYAIGRWEDPLGHAHNYLLNLGAETGLIGLLGYLLFWGWTIGYAVRGLLKTEVNSLNRAMLAGGIGILVHLHLHNLLDNLYVQGMYLHIALVLGLITLLVNGDEDTISQNMHAPSRKL